MGEICKDPQNAARSSTIEGTRSILSYLIVHQGISQTIRILQYVLEDLASSINPQNRGDVETAARYSRAAETLEKPYQIIKSDEIKIIYDT